MIYIEDIPQVLVGYEIYPTSLLDLIDTRLAECLSGLEDELDKFYIQPTQVGYSIYTTITEMQQIYEKRHPI